MKWPLKKKKKTPPIPEETAADAARDRLENAQELASRAKHKLSEANDILDQLCSDLLKEVAK